MLVITIDAGKLQDKILRKWVALAIEDNIKKYTECLINTQV